MYQIFLEFQYFCISLYLTNVKNFALIDVQIMYSI